MDFSKKEISPAPSASSKGFKGVIAKARIGRKDESSATSLNGTDDSSERSGIRDSVDSLIDRAREARASKGSSIDDNGLPSGPSNLSKLIPGRVKKKLKKREEAVKQQEEEADGGRGRSLEDQTATSALLDAIPNNRRRSTLEEDGADSLITVDSEVVSPAVAPPSLVSHPSHVGYLTSSSPLIKTSIPSAPPGNLEPDSPTFQNPQYQKSNTLPTTAKIPYTASNLAPQRAATLESGKIETSLSAAGGSRSRGVSPGARIKDVFTPGSRKKGASPPKSPDRASMKPSGDGGALGDLISKETRRKSHSTSNNPGSSDSPPSINVDPTKSPYIGVRELPSIATSPRTPTSAGLEAPETTVTPPTPTDQRVDVPNSPSLNSRPTGPAGTNPNTVVSASGNMISHRRVRSDSATHLPSKLSNAMSAPLTPMAEEKTPETRSPGSQGSPGGSAGFFSSVFSAAQTAANTLSNTISNTNQPRSRSSTQIGDESIDQDLAPAAPTFSENEKVAPEQKKQLAIDTLGAGDLSLSHLGIASDSPPIYSASSNMFPNAVSEVGKDGIVVQREEAAARAENVSAARAVSAAYSEKPSEDNLSILVAEDAAPAFRPRSTYESSIMTGDKTPPNGSVYEGDAGFRRSGSVRSRAGALARRHRNSSSATGSTIAAGIGASHAALANLSAASSSPKLTGFAVASKKRNRDFHQLFRSVPEDDYLIEDYSCALQREIILAGRIYVSEGHICFSSNILGWVTTLIISFDEVVSVEKENTAVVFPNAIAIQTLHARHTFRSLLSREATYDLLIGIWKLSHPSLKSSLNGVRLDQGGTGDKTEKVDPASDGLSEISDQDEEVYDEDEEEGEGVGSVTEAGDGSIAGSDDGGEQGLKPVTRKASKLGVAVGAAAGEVPTVSEAKAAEKASGAAVAANVDFPGPATHAPTECSDLDSHYDKPLKDDIIPAPLGKVYSMVFGPASGGFMAKWLLDDMKSTDLQMEDDKRGVSDEKKSRTFSYIKPLYSSIGPKSTKCVVTETLDSLDLEKAMSITVSTQTPDVPSGNVFCTKTHYCFMWAPGNATRVVINYTIEWTGKSWLKGPIEKGATDGQITYCNDLVKALKAGVSPRPRAGTGGSKVKNKGKRRKGDQPAAKRSTSDTEAGDPNTQSKDETWGIFEPLHDILGPVIDIFSPMISSNMIVGFLLFIILFNWIRGPRTPSGSSLSYPGMSSPERLAAYEQIWRREENDLWDWLDQRIGMQGLAYPENRDRGELTKARLVRQQSLKGIRMRTNLEDLRMNEREVDHAIKVTEERLVALKSAVRKKKALEAEAEAGVAADKSKAEPE